MKQQKILCFSILTLTLLSGCDSYIYADYEHKNAFGDNTLTIYNCEDYIDESLIQAFEEEYNVFNAVYNAINNTLLQR